ncbi:MAG: hypothetical protein H7249_08535 [Chitinophagaceae bacterium]|nr:hypothetical protein [Oligoflexus sp.]
MDHKKIDLDPEDIKKLRALLKAEEDKVDELSDAELAQAEEALSRAVRKLTSDTAQDSAKILDAREIEAIDASWQKIQKQLNPVGRADGLDGKNNENLVTLASRAKKKSFPWATLGMLAIAALALLVVYPKIQHSDSDVAIDPANMQTKGAAETFHYATFCDVEVEGPTADSVEKTGDGKAYNARSHDQLHINLLCDQSGFIQLWSTGGPAAEYRDIPVTRNVRTAITDERGAVNFSLRGAKDMHLGVALTENKIDQDVNLFEAEIPARTLGSSKVLWSDSVDIRGRTR